MLTDPIADMLTRIRNANKALQETATMPTSRMKESIARLLKEEGYIRDFRVEKGEAFDTLVVELKYGRNPDDVRLLRDIADADRWWVLVLKRYRIHLMNERGRNKACEGVFIVPEYVSPNAWNRWSN